MKKYSKYALLVIAVMLILFGSVLQINNNKKIRKNKIVNIEEVLLSPNYSYLPAVAKDYIRNYYQDTGEVLLTEKNKEEDQAYLNPQYVEYLEGNGNGSSASPSPTIIDFNPKMVKLNAGRGVLPASYDLRDVDGKNYVTPFEAQGFEGLCWDYASNAHFESSMLVKSGESYNSSSIILSKHQLDYASSGITTYGRKAYNSFTCGRDALSGAGDFACFAEVGVDGLGTVPNEWDANHSKEIAYSEEHPKEAIDAVDIYNFNNSLYEVNSTLDFPVLNFTTASDEEKNAYLSEIKNNIMNYGGASINVANESNSTLNPFHGEDIKTIHAYGGRFGHAMQIIGWDDDFEYTICTNTGGSPYPSDCPDAKDHFTGKGVWIAKNSDMSNPITLIGYASPDNDINFVTNYGKKSWDNFYQLEENYVNDTTKNYTFKEDKYIDNEKINKIKMYLGQNTNYKIYIDVSGNSNFTLLEDITSTYSGYYYFDYASANYNISENTAFRIVSNNSSLVDFRVYTTNNSSNVKIKTFDIVYNFDNATFNNNKYFDLNVYSNTKNIADNEKLTFKIKDSNGTYINQSGYKYDYNGVYANISDARLTINSDYFSKGDYVIETYYNNNLYATSNLKIEIDLAITQGDGSDENPWQISTPEQFSLIRNNPYDSYKLMNDIDFAYDTQNENGQFYNDGFGFSAIEEFYGYLDGNGHSIKNLYSKSNIDENTAGEVSIGGIFDKVTINPIQCKLDKCGFGNIKIVNPNIIGSYNTGGLVNNLLIDTVDIEFNNIFKFDNISVIGGTITNANTISYMIGGLVGSFSTSEFYIDSKIIFNNLYNSSHIISSSTDSRFEEQIGGIIASLLPASSALIPNEVELNNIMNIGKIEKSNYTVAAANLFNFSYANRSNVSINNAISINNQTLKDIDAFTSSTNLNVNLNNIYTSSSTVIKGGINHTDSNVLTNQAIYEIANGNYSNWNNFNDNWYQNKDDNINRIPVLKGITYDYLDIDQTLVLEEGQTIDVLDYVHSTNKDIIVSNTCSYNLDVCDNTTDSNVITISGTKLTAVGNGTTSIIVMNSHDGYIGKIDVYVGDYVTVTYNSNDGNNTTYNQAIEKSTDTKLDANKFNRTGYKFISWNTKADGSGTEYTDQQSINIDENIQLYAIWKPIEYTVVFNANGGTGEMNNISAVYGKEYTLADNKYVREHYFFMDWNTKSDGTGTKYSDKAKIKNLTTVDNATVTLYANWKAADGIINFHANNDTEQSISQEFIYDNDFNLKDNTFTKEGYKFIKWNTKADGSGTSYNNKQLMHINHEENYKTIDLYAIWDEEYDFIINNYASDREEKIIDLIDYNTNIDEFKSNIVLNPNYSLKVDYKEVNGNQCVYTGGKVKIFKNNELYMEFVSIVRGDVSGSGDIDIIDYIRIKKDITNKKKLEGVYKTAADFSKNGEIDSADYTKVRNIIMGDEQ